MNIKKLIFESQTIKGVFSVCSSNKYVIKAAFAEAKENRIPALIESTANQVNQLGGYSGMTPEMFRDYVYGIADECNFDKNSIILGGDHLGPLIWKNQSESDAMQYAINLISDYAKAGFQKIHIDTSMKLASDSKNIRLSDEIISRRASILIKCCESARKGEVAYVIGSEVPVPGGTACDTESMQITKVSDLQSTLICFENALKASGLEPVLKNIIGVVIQPGVEFGDDEIHQYNRKKTVELTNFIHSQNNLVYEGHSTDYQPRELLREMVEDGIRILKVGPALTFYFREALYALERIEREYPFSEYSSIRSVFEREMLSSPEKWIDYYTGSDVELKLKRHFSYSDRIRYYSNTTAVNMAITTLIRNLSTITIPLSLLAEYLPVQYQRAIRKTIKIDPESLIVDKIRDVIKDYIYAIKY